jgi:hypothetical protein
VSKRFVPLAALLLLGAVPASAWAASNGGTPVPAAPVAAQVVSTLTTVTTVTTTLPGGATLAGTIARAPRGAPRAVRLAIAAANQLQTFPYRFGGGHAAFKDTAYDCSGTVSYMLHGAGLLASPLDSTGLMTWGVPGPGRWITVYANARHAYAVVAGLRLDTAGGPGPRWHAPARSAAGFTARHPAGL